MPISIHAAREGGDLFALRSATVFSRFQSTPPVKAATGLFVEMKRRNGFQSTPPVKAATRAYGSNYIWCRISIHAAREGGDVNGTAARVFSKLFQSTPPVKAATAAALFSTQDRQISIHAAREGGDRKKSNNTANNSISIHAAREGGDSNQRHRDFRQAISIHAAREGGDMFVPLFRLQTHGAFQSTPPVKAATYLPFLKYFIIKISIHAAREGGDEFAARN